MTNYRNGYELERAAKRLLEDNGYYVVRAAGSKGAADLVALKRGEVVLVQCKLDGYLLPREREKFGVLADTLAAFGCVASWEKEGRTARTVRIQAVGYTGTGYVLVNWSPDWAMEES